MKKQILTLVGIIIILALIVIAFGGFFAYQYFTSHAPNSPSLTTTSALTLSNIDNATYNIANAQAQFSNGAFYPQRNSATSVDQGLNAVISSYAFGDVNGDGQGDAVVVTESGMGARDARTDALQIVLNVHGKPEATNVTIPGRVGDKLATGFSVISINSTGLITLQLTTTSTTIMRTYRYGNGILVESNATASLKTYTDTENGFTIQYDPSLTVNTSKPETPLETNLENPTAQTLLSINSGPETLSISVSPDPKDVGNCMISQATGTKGASTVKINGVSFLTYGMGDAAMGSWTSDTTYHTIRNNACWMITTEVQGHNTSMYDDPTAAATAQNKILDAAAALIDPIIQTFQFIGGTTTMAPPTYTLSADKFEYALGDVINLTWSTQGATRAFWYQLIDPNSPTRKNIVPPQGTPGLSGKAVTVANIQSTYEPITMQVAGPGGFGTCSAYVSIKNSAAQPFITVDSGTISLSSNGAGNVNVTLQGTATNGALYNDDINVVLFDAEHSGPFDEATVYQSAFGQQHGPWLSGGADITLRNDSVPFEHWVVKAYAPAGTTRVRVLAYPFFSSSVNSPTQPIVNRIITLTPTN
jgi:hypothetical protein